jgi:hypothetical protein
MLSYSGHAKIAPNGSAIVSTGMKTTEFPIKHLAKTFLFCFVFSISKPNQKDFSDLVKSSKLWVEHQNPI